MLCHICREPAIGQCRTCWRFYCASHGNVECETCAASRKRAQPSSLKLGEYGRLDAAAADEQVVTSRMTFRNLRRIVTINQTKPWSAREMTIVSLDLYDDGTVLRFRYPMPAFDPSRNTDFAGLVAGLPTFRVEDNVGTAYRTGMGGMGGESSEGLSGEARITPAIPDSASSLTIRVREPLTGSADSQSALTRLKLAMGVGDQKDDPTTGDACVFEVSLRA